MKTPSREKKFSGKSATEEAAPKSKAHHRSGVRTGRTSLKTNPETPSKRAAAGFPIVGVGASAGGLEAFTHLLQNLPTNTGMGFVLVQHLDPDHDSALTQLLSKATSLPVHEVTNNLRVQPNHVYIIPPNTCMSIARGVLKLRAREEQGRTPHHSIDFFLESLAQDQHERAIGIILSGTASDGTLGLEAIKAEDGITFAQDESAKYDSMPRSAVAAGCVDFVLSPENIARELARIAKHQHAGIRTQNARAPRGESTSRLRDEASRRAASSPEHQFNKILLLLRNRCGVDFSLYKSTTIHRRVNRRMLLNKLPTLAAYARFLRGNIRELDALYSDALISVTSFFRDPEAFAILGRKVFPRLISERGQESLRMWVVGCSTGQEAYSLAMAYTESSDRVPGAPTLQLFATDLHEALLDKARAGLYAKSMVKDISPQRLRRFFTEQDGGYRISKPLRQAVVFARQNLLSDPPFSRMDLISCRNLLIYVEPSLQEKVMATFHFALRPKGSLLLGAAESVGSCADLFEPLDKKHKIYFRIPGPSPAWRLHRVPKPAKAKKEIAMPKPARAPEGGRAEINVQREADRITLNRFAPTSVLVNSGLQALQFRGDTGRYLKPPTGQASLNILKMAREGLMLPLRAAINKAKKQNKVAHKKNVRVNQNGQTRTANLEVVPLKNVKERCYLIFFEDAETRVLQKETKETKKSGKETSPSASLSSFPSLKISSAVRRRVAELETELNETRDYVQALQEQHEASNEELQSSNEEVTSANEELQSTNEELETSKEELESVNEEITTVNEEMIKRNAELNRLNSDLVNLQASTHLVILLLGRDLTIRRFSTQAENQFNLMAADVGRSISSIRHNLDVPDLERFIAGVVDTGSEREREVRDRDGRWYSLRVRPYLTLDNKLDGAVLVLVNIDALKQTERTITEARDYAESIIRTARDPLMILDAALRVQMANEAFYTTFKVSRAEAEGRTLFELDHGHWDIPKLRELLEDILPRHSFFNNFEVSHEFENIGHRTMLLNARTLSETSGYPARILLGIQDVTELLHFQAAMRRSELRYRRLFEAAKDGVLIIDPETRRILDANPFMTELLGYTRQELLGKELFEVGLLKDEGASRGAFRELQQMGVIRYEDLPLQTKRGERREVEFISTLYHEGEERIIQCSIRDITKRMQAEKALRQAQAQLADRAAQLEGLVAERAARLQETVRELEAFSYSIAHDMRAPLRSMAAFARLVQTEHGEQLDETGKEYLGRVVSAAQRLDRLITDVLSYSSVTRRKLEMQPVDLEKLVEEAIRNQPEFQPPRAEIEIQTPLHKVMTHEPSLMQCVSNLLSNAVKSVSPGVVPRIKVWSEARAEEGMNEGERSATDQSINPSIRSSTNPPPVAAWVRLWIEDNGIGLAPADKERILSLFGRLHPVAEFEGTGIGLTIVRKAVERMGGKVGVESEPGKGSRFWIQLREAEDRG
jgi:two-component system CheB/CheR fusion protein